MEKKELCEVRDRFARSGLQSMKWSEGEFSLELQMPTAVASGASATAPMAAAVAVAAPVVETAAPAGEFVRAPLVGTYYAAAAPGAEPYVHAGDRVKKGETLCLIEAMKTMSEIPAPCDMVVEEILVEDGALVAFDAPLMRYSHV